MNQGHVILSMVHNVKITDKNGKVKTLWDAFKVEDDKLVWDTANFGKQDEWSDIDYRDPETKAKTSKLRELINTSLDVRHATQGNYTDAMLAKSKVFGRVYMLFRQWIPQAIYQRFGQQVGDSFKGRYRTWADMKSEMGFWETAGRIVRDTVLGAGLPIIGRLGGNWLAKGTQEKMLSKGLSPIDQENYRMNIRELQFLAIMYFMMTFFRKMAEDDEDDNLPQELWNYSFNQTQRFWQELTFFYSPTNAYQIIRDFIPITKTLTDLGALAPASWNYVFDHENDEYQRGFRQGSSKLAHAITNNVPVWRAINLGSSLLSQTFGSETYRY